MQEQQAQAQLFLYTALGLELVEQGVAHLAALAEQPEVQPLLNLLLEPAAHKALLAMAARQMLLLQ
jgi:hypothetical protein